MNVQPQDNRFLENRKQNFGLHHTFDADLAVELKSIDLAVLVHHFQFWIRFNVDTQVNLHDGRTWTFQTLKDISAHFPYWTPRQVEKLIIKLVAAGILIKGNYNKSPYDRTVWYAFKDEERFSIRRNRQMPDVPPISPNGEIENTEKGNQFPQTVTPIPDTLKKKKKKKSASLPSIEFDYEINQFVNIQESDKSDWATLYPGVNIDLELGKMRQWLMDPKNPERDGNRTFITNWLSRAAKEVAKTPRKPKAEPEAPTNPSGNNIPYNSSIAYSILHRDGIDEYVDYLKGVNEQQYYNNYLKGKYEQNYIDYVKEKGIE